MRLIASAFLCGLVFGLGLVLSAMVNPQKILNFLDFFGTWDPSLAFVMAGAIAVTLPGYRFVLRRPSPMLSPEFLVPGAKDIDPRLVGGAALFGVGWGLVGYCPGPAVAALGIGGVEVLIFVVAMLVGMAAYGLGARLIGGQGASG